MSAFIAIVLTIWALMHAYVFWRLSSVPLIERNLPAWMSAVIGFLFWAMFPLSRVIASRVPKQFALAFEYISSNWIGVLFLLMCCFLAVDFLTLGGVFFRKWMPQIRMYAAIVGLVLALVALVQGHRDPVVTSCEIELKDLPPQRDGTVLVAVSDIHLGGLIRDRWLNRIIGQVNSLKPDVVLVVGDLVDGDVPRVSHMAQQLRTINAPLGVWGVTGNHDFYAGLAKSVQFFERGGIRLLRDESVEVATGLTLAGIDDLTARLQFGLNGKPLEKALSGANAAGATILLSHSPMLIEEAADRGADLILCGHTHNGQIWPFTHLVRLRYPMVHGGYQVGNTTILVGRGAGTWGPRMRLWHPGEILKITLRSAVGRAVPSSGDS